MARSFKRNVGLNGVYNGDSEFMAGESIMFSGPVDKIPAGYLVEDGAAVGRVAYATLFAAIGTTYGAGDGSTTFNLPDSRGDFWRCLDLGRGVDAGRVLGVAQLDAFQGFFVGDGGYLTGTSSGYANASSGGRGGVYTKPLAGSSSDGFELRPMADGVNGSPRMARETRPRNIAKIPLIKY